MKKTAALLIASACLFAPALAAAQQPESTPPVLVATQGEDGGIDFSQPVAPDAPYFCGQWVGESEILVVVMSEPGEPAAFPADIPAEFVRAAPCDADLNQLYARMVNEQTTEEEQDRAIEAATGLVPPRINRLVEAM